MFDDQDKHKEKEEPQQANNTKTVHKCKIIEWKGQ